MANVIPMQQNQMQAQNTDNQKSIFDPQAFNHMMVMAEQFAKSKLVPQQFQEAPSDCLIAIQYAAELNINPLQFMQNSYIVHGKPGIESKLAIALANNSGLFEGVIEYRIEGTGDKMKCTAFAKLKQSGSTIEATVSMADAKAEKWTDKPGSKWKTMPQLMLKYRSAMFLIRTHCPQVIIGLQSKEELIDVHGDKKVKNVTPEKLDLSSLKIANAPSEPVSERPAENKSKDMSMSEKIDYILTKMKNDFFVEKDTLEKYLKKEISDSSFDDSDLKSFKGLYLELCKEKEKGESAVLSEILKSGME